MEQGTARIRHFKSKEYNYLILPSHSDIPQTNKEFDRWIMLNKVNKHFIPQILTTRYDHEGKLTQDLSKDEKEFYNLFRLHNTNKSKDLNNFIPRWIKYKYKQGFRHFKYIDKTDNQDNQDKYKEFRGYIAKIKATEQKNIREAKIITPVEAEEIKKELEKEVIVSKEDIYKLKKNIVCDKYGLTRQEAKLLSKEDTVERTNKKDKIKYKVNRNRLIFEYMNNNKVKYSTLKGIIKNSSPSHDIQNGINHILNDDNVLSTKIIKKNKPEWITQDIGIINHIIEVLPILAKHNLNKLIQGESTQKDIQHTMDNINEIFKRDEKLIAYFYKDDEQYNKHFNNVNSVLSWIVKQNSGEKINEMYGMLKKIGWADIMDDKKIYKDEIQDNVWNLWEKGEIKIFVNKIKGLYGRRFKRLDMDKWKDDKAKIMKGFLMIFNSLLAELGIKIVSDTTRLRKENKRPKIYRIAHLGLWYFLQKDINLKDNELIQKYKTMGGWDKFKMKPTNTTNEHEDILLTI